VSISVQTADFDVGAELSILGEVAGAGAVASFIGHVRGGEGADAIDAMTLEHYPGMTEKSLAEIVAQAQERWPLLGVRVIHRVGRLLPGERIVLVGVASRHRQAAFEACAFIMDYLKTQAPFWKKEHTAHGARWVDARESDEAAASRWGSRKTK
jgi:molybdopterin synthase catalytic subunit